MKLIQLNKRALPASPDIDKLFPYLLEDDRNGTTVFRLAFLTAKANVLLGSCLEHLGFALLPDGVAIDPPDSLGLTNPDAWQFVICGDDGPFVPLTDDGGAAPELRLSHYFAFEGLTADPVTVPTEITVHHAQLSRQAFKNANAWKLRGQEQGEPATWRFRWAARWGARL